MEKCKGDSKAAFGIAKKWVPRMDVTNDANEQRKLKVKISR